MKSAAAYGFSFLLFLCACVGQMKEEPSEGASAENDLDAGRSFIRALLDGRLRDARSLLLPDATNTEYMDAFQRHYETRMEREERRGYRESSINIHGLRQIGDTATIITYSNSFKKVRDSVRVVQRDGRWLVDLKYSFPKTNP